MADDAAVIDPVAETAAQPHWRPWLPWAGALIGVAALAFVLRRFDLDRFLAVLAGADPRLLVLVPLALMAEQLVRAWKWRQLLHPLWRGIGVLRLFGAIMAGHLLALLVPFGFGTVARSWLVARREDLRLGAVLATVALDRLTDGVVFACLVLVALLSVAFPDPGGGIRAGIAWGGAGSFVLFALLLATLALYRRGALQPDGRVATFVNRRLPTRLAAPARRLAAAFAEGIAWPAGWWRGAGVLLASIAIKLLAATHFLWAGLALSVALEPMQYLFLVVFLGFLVILGYFARLTGGFVVGAIFALGLFGVPEEALAMVLIVQASNLLSVAGIGALSRWWQGVALGEMRSAARHDATIGGAGG